MTAVFTCWTRASADYAKAQNQQAAGAIVGMIFVYCLFYTIMHPLTYVYITEVFPLVHCAKGVALTQLFSRGSSSFNQGVIHHLLSLQVADKKLTLSRFVNPIGIQSIGWK